MSITSYRRSLSPWVPLSPRFFWYELRALSEGCMYVIETYQKRKRWVEPCNTEPNMLVCWFTDEVFKCTFYVDTICLWLNNQTKEKLQNVTWCSQNWNCVLWGFIMMDCLMKLQRKLFTFVFTLYLFLYIRIFWALKQS